MIDATQPPQDRNYTTSICLTFITPMLSSRVILFNVQQGGGSSVGGWLDHLQQAPPEQIKPQRITIIM